MGTVAGQNVDDTRNVYTPEPDGTIRPRLGVERGTETDALLDGSWSMFGSADELVDVIDNIYTDDWTIQDMDRALRSDGKMRALELVMTLPIRSAAGQWKLEPAEGTDGQARVIAELTGMLDGMRVGVPDLVAQMTTAFARKRSYHEKVFVARDGKLTYDTVAFRPAATCTLVRDGRSGKVDGFKQTVPGSTDPVFITNPYAFVYIHGRNQDPIRGISDFEVAYRCYEAKAKLKFLWFNFLENTVLPRLLLKGKNPATLGKAVKTVAKLKNSGVVGVPSDWMDGYETIDISGKGGEEFSKAIGTLDSEASVSMMAGFVDLTDKAVNSAVGSYALSSSQIGFFMDLMGGYAQEIEQTITDGLVKDLVVLNYGTGVPVPRFRLGPLQAEDSQTAVSLLESMSAGVPGVVPADFIEQLVVKVGAALNMDMGALKRALAENAEQAKAAVAVAGEGEGQPEQTEDDTEPTESDDTDPAQQLMADINGT